MKTVQQGAYTIISDTDAATVQAELNRQLAAGAALIAPVRYAGGTAVDRQGRAIDVTPTYTAVTYQGQGARA
jgi:hypothetical protein